MALNFKEKKVSQIILSSRLYFKIRLVTRGVAYVSNENAK